MGKKKKKKITQAQLKSERKPNFFSAHPHWSAAIILFVLLLIFYYPIVFENKTLLPPDTLTAKSYNTFVKDALKSGTYPLWNPYIFSGMPSFASLSSAPLVNIVDSIVQYSIQAVRYVIPLTPFMRIILNYVFFGMLVYLLLNSLKVNRYASLFGAIAVMFVPQYVAFTAFGHNTKFLSLVLIPLIFWSVDRMIKKQNLFYFSLTALALGFQLIRAHVQVCYYTYLLLGIYIIYLAVIELRESKKITETLKGFGLLVAAGIAAVAMSAVMYVSIYEYSHYSIRGGSAGLSYDYASSWSFSPAEMITFFVPSFFGFGGATYWGKMPFTDYPLYMGIIVLFLAGIALVLKRDRYTIFFSVIALFSLIVSFGKHLPILYDPMFKFLPFFNKFRVPSMIHILLDLSMVILAGLGVGYLMELKEKAKEKSNDLEKKLKNVKNYFYIFGGVAMVIMLFVALSRNTIFNWMSHAARPLSADAMKVAYKMALTDSVVMLILLGAAGFLVIYYLSSQMKENLLGLSLILLVIVDFWVIDFKIIHPKPAMQESAYFQKTDVVSFLEKQPGPFRIYPVKLNQPGEKPDNWWMYFKLQNIYGYHAAKIKIYQETMDEIQFPQMFLFKYLKQGVDEKGKRGWMFRAPNEIDAKLAAGQATFLDMLNCRYVISSYPLPDTSFQMVFRGSQFVFKNKKALPRAFFVDSVIVTPDKAGIFAQFESGKFDPKKLAILEEPPAFAVRGSQGNSVAVTNYDIHDIKLKASVKTPGLMVLSEVFYPAGWHAYVDGQKTKIYKTNYILRSIFLQPGEHKIEFKFEPASFKIGLLISLFSLLAVVAAFVISIRKQKSQ
ncbi:MAG: YfhO family protein [Calditrichaeota bacterium]|nr:YfhO family protein [Calditrichota bacterium]